MATILTMPAADVGTLAIKTTHDQSSTRFEVWHDYGGTDRQVGWVIKEGRRWEIFDLDEERRWARHTEVVKALAVYSQRQAEEARARRTENEKAEAAS